MTFNGLVYECLTICVGPGRFTFKETVLEDPKLPAKLKLHQVYGVPFLNGSNGKSLMLVRKDMIDQWESGLDKKSDYYLQGAPGIGKTLLSRGMCIFSHFTESKDVCFMQLNLEGCDVVILQRVGNQCGVQCHLHTEEWTVEALSDAIIEKSPQVSMIVVDGIKQASFEKLLLLATKVSNLQNTKDISCQIIFVTSQQVDFTKTHEFGPRLQQRLKPIHPQPVSWALEEYKIACKNTDLWSQIAKTLGHDEQVEYNESKKFEAVEEKFFYCGGSARWMFNLSISQITAAIDSKTEGFYNLQSFLSGSAGMSSPLAVNTLYQQFRGGSSTRISFFISEYAMRRIVERIGDEASNFMWNWATASNHPPVRGLAYEGKCMAAWKNTTMSLTLTYLDTLRTTSSNTTTEVNENVKNKKVKSRGQAQSILSLDVQGELSTANLKAGQTDIVIIPGKWNQKCFDFAFIQKKEIYCVQCTLEKSHSRLISAIGDIINSCREKSILVKGAHLVALTDQSKFKFEKAQEFAAGIDKIMCWWAKYEPR